jgi:hypothetical protein
VLSGNAAATGQAAGGTDGTDPQVTWNARAMAPMLNPPHLAGSSKGEAKRNILGPDEFVGMCSVRVMRSLGR